MPKREGSLLPVILVAALLAIGVVAWVSLRSPQPTATKRAQRDTVDVPALEPADDRAGAAHANAAPAGASAPAPKMLDHARREQLRAVIWQAIGHPAPAEEPPPTRGAPYTLPDTPEWERRPPPPAQDPPAPPGKIDPSYIQDRVRNDFFPLARQCYSDGLVKNPALAGEVRFAFNIVGDEKTSGIVESVDVLNASTLRDPDVIECMRQSFLSVTFPPPEGGGEVTVIYPIIFSNDDGG